MTTCLHELLTLQISNCMTLHSLSWPRAAATTRCAALHEQDNIEIYVNRAEHVSAPNAESSALCRLTLGRSTTHQNCACPWIHGSAPSMSVWTCCSADLRLRRSVTVQIWEVIRRLSLHRTSGLQNPTDICRASSCVSATPVQGMQVCEAMEFSSSKLPELQGRNKCTLAPVVPWAAACFAVSCVHVCIQQAVPQTRHTLRLDMLCSHTHC